MEAEAAEGTALIVIIAIALLIGAIAGWLAGLIVKGSGFGVWGDIIVGIVGSLVASILLPAIGIHLGPGLIPTIISAVIGAVILLLVVKLLRRA